MAEASIQPNRINLAEDFDFTGELTKNGSEVLTVADIPGGTVISVNGQDGVVVLDSDDIAQGVANLYFTDEAAQDAVGGIVDSTLVYVDATPILKRAPITGDITIPDGSNTAAIGTGVIVNADINASAAIDVSKTALALTTTGSSGAATLIGNTLNIPQYAGGGGGTVDSVVGTASKIDVDSTDPANPIVSLATAVTNSLALADSAVQDLSDLGITATATEINYTAGVTSAIQTQLNNKQPLDADLTTLAGLTATTDNFIVSVASAWASRTPAQVRTTLALVIGTDVQAWDADLDIWATKTAPSGTVLGTTDTQTLTNKRVTPRTGTTTSSATPTINTDNVDFYSLTAQTVDITSFTTNLSGTPTDGQKLWIAITGTAARAITWGASFEASTTALPTTTVSTDRLDVGFVWNAATSKWRCVAVT